MVQTVEGLLFNSNSTERYKNIFRHVTELNKQTPIPLVFNDNIYHKGNISKMPDFDGVFFLIRMSLNVMGDLVVNVKMVI